MKLVEDAPPKSRVEMTPLMDVVFLLLVFFIYAFMTMTVQRGVKVDLPKADGTIEKARTIRIVLTENDEFLLDGRTPMTAKAVIDAVRLRHETLGLPVVISVDRQAHAGIALELLARLRAEGVTKITYQVDKSSP